MELQAYDLWFESGDEVATFPVDSAGLLPTRARFETPADGWVGGAGPAIGPDLWPRHPASAESMIHGITLRLPPAYQRRGPDFPAVSFFQGVEVGGFAVLEPLPPGAHGTPDPRIELRPDIIGGYGVLLWITQEEFAGPHSRPSGYLGGLEEAQRRNPAFYAAPTRSVWLAPRDGDPNVGRAPRDYWPGDVRGDDDYINPYQHPEFGLDAAGFAGISHLGGTSFPAQNLPEGLSPFYLEIDAFDGLNFGDGGNAQIDLANSVYDWACG